MRSVVPIILLALIASSAAAQETEIRNDWPILMETPSRAGRAHERDILGPFFFRQPLATGADDVAAAAHGFRPFFVECDDSGGRRVSAYSLYPLFSYHAMRDGSRWSFFELINHDVHHVVVESSSDKNSPLSPAPAEARATESFDIWPFYFSVQTSSPQTSYRAVLPIAGTVQQRFGIDRLSWVLFPLYARWEKNRVVTTTAPYPFIKVLRGEGNHGFEFWPVAGFREKANAYRRQFYLWPLIYRQETQLWLAQPDVKAGFLPFYTFLHDASSRSETFLWPFFGYTDRTEPFRYHQTNYLWPILVQGRGNDRYLDRWGPFYTHSVIKGVATTWLVWPLWRNQQFADGTLVHRNRQFLYFLYNDHEQRSATHPALPAAHRTNVWPLFTWWNNGAGRKQFQAVSPLEVFFPTNNAIRVSYSAFFALYRFNQLAPDDTEQSALWNFITYRHARTTREFHLGPLFSHFVSPEQRRFAIGNGVIAWQRQSRADAEARWHVTFFDFTPPRIRQAAASRAHLSALSLVRTASAP